jgi:hypothetical protein
VWSFVFLPLLSFWFGKSKTQPTDLGSQSLQPPGHGSQKACRQAEKIVQAAIAASAHQSQSSIEKKAFNSDYYKRLSESLDLIEAHPILNNLAAQPAIGIKKPGDSDDIGYQAAH